MAEARLVITALALMLAMFLAGVHGLRHRVGTVILALLSVAWLTVDRMFEGTVIFQVGRSHGFTVADLVGVLGLVVAGLLFWHASGPAPARDAVLPEQDPVPDERLEHSSVS